ncbi:lipoprotein [uncultured Gilliamella sp.]|nr:lipoprotein [uncultured Gilliamella sp.]
MKFFIKLLSVFLVVLTLASCGLKGPLYYPSDNVLVDYNSFNQIA